jgi:putative protease
MVAVKKQLDIAKKAGASYGVCGNCNAIPLLQESGLKILGEYSMNVCNAYGVDVCQEQGFSALVLSPELKFSQMAFAKTPSIPCGVFVYGRLPLMLTRNCPVKAAGKSCRECRQNGSLTDRKGVTFPVICQNGCAELLNSVPTYLGDQTDSIPGHLFHWFHFTDETQEEVCAVLQQYRDGQPSEKPITRGLYKKGVL